MTLVYPEFGDSGDDLRAMLAYYDVHSYQVAYRLGMHPSTLSRYLRNYRPLDPKLVQAIKDAVKTESVRQRAELVAAERTR